MHDSFASGASATYSPTDPPTPEFSVEETDDDIRHPLFISIVQVLSGNAEYANAIIDAVRSLPKRVQNILLGPESGTNDSLVSDSGDAPKDGSNTPSNQTSHPTTQATRRVFLTKSPSVPRSRVTRKRSDPPDDDEQDNREDRTGESGDPPSKKQRKKAKWACPYYLAYPNLTLDSKFSSCRPPGYLNNRSEWKSVKSCQLSATDLVLIMNIEIT
jgi:hypothetical protein